MYIGDYASAIVHIRGVAAGALESIGPAAKEAVPGLIQLLCQDPEPAIRTVACRALFRIAPESPEPRAALLAALGDGSRGRAFLFKEWQYCQLELWERAEALGPQFLAQAARAVLRLLRDKNTAVGRWAADLFCINPEAAKAVVPELLVLFADKKCANRDLIAAALGLVGAAEAVPELIKALQQKRKQRLRKEAVIALGLLGPVAAPAVLALQQLLSESGADVDTRDSVETALSRISGQDPPRRSFRDYLERRGLVPEQNEAEPS
jgi:HEAT repeat protein